ncbi:unnamed protein product, partial [Oppiella nova]
TGVQTAPAFCSDNYVDAVLWDGLSYRVTRNVWIASYDQIHRKVSKFLHKSQTDFPEEKGYYYQSGYHIPRVPDCDRTHLSCQLMEALSGLTIYTIRDTISGETVYRMERNTRHKSLLHDINIKYFFESNLMPRRLAQKYRPSVYIPSHYMFVHVMNKYRNFGPLIETIELRANGVIERSYYELTEPRDTVFVTSFWWELTQRVYIIGESTMGFGNAFLYELQMPNKTVVINPINMTVLEFFGCVHPKTTRPTHTIINHTSINSTNTTEQYISVQTSYDENDYNDMRADTQDPDPPAADTTTAEPELDFWKHLFIIIYFMLILYTLLMCIFGCISMIYLRRHNIDNRGERLVEREDRATGLKSVAQTPHIAHKQLRFNDHINDFFIEEYEASPKIPTHLCRSVSCHTIDSFEGNNTC